MALRMASKNEMDDVERFMNGPIFKWFTTCMEFIVVQPNEGLTFETLIDGVLIHKVFCQTNLQVVDDTIAPPLNEKMRYLNLKKIMENIRHFFEVDENQAIWREPNIDSLIKEPELNVRELENLLYLLLGCAVSSPNKKLFIDSIKELDIDDQAEIVECIKKVLKTSEYLLSFEMFTAEESREESALRALDCIREMKAEINSFREIDQNQTAVAGSSQIISSPMTPGYRTKNDRHSQLEHERLHRFKINEIQNQLQDALKDLETCQQNCQQLKKEKAALETNVRLVKIYRDELDVMKVNAERAERLESEIENYKMKMEQFIVCKKKLEKVMEENHLLRESKAADEEHFKAYKSRTEQVRINLKKRIAKLEEEQTQLDALNRSINEENNDLREKYDKLLEYQTRDSFNRTSEQSMIEYEQPCHESTSLNISLSDELAETSKTTMQKILVEGRRLERVMESLQANQKSDNQEDFKEDRRTLSGILRVMREYAENLTGKSSYGDDLETSDDTQLELQRLARVNENLLADLEMARSTIINQSNHMRSLNSRDMELQNLREKVDKIQVDYSRLYDENVKLKRRQEAETISYRENEVRLTRKLHAKDREVGELGYQLDIMTDRCDAQAQTISDITMEKKILKDANEQLRQQNQEFYMRWIKEVQHFQDECQSHTEMEKRLSRAKERLEDKIIEMLAKQQPVEKTNKKRTFVQETLTLLRRTSEIFRRRRSGGGVFESAACLVPDDFEYTRPACRITPPTFPSSSTPSSLDSDNEPASSASSVPSDDKVIANLVNNVFPASEFSPIDTDDNCNREVVDNVSDLFNGTRNRAFWSPDVTRNEEDDGLRNSNYTEHVTARIGQDDENNDKNCQAYAVAKPTTFETETNLGCA